jgi:hypothetical protein
MAGRGLPRLVYQPTYPTRHHPVQGFISRQDVPVGPATTGTLLVPIVVGLAVSFDVGSTTREEAFERVLCDRLEPKAAGAPSVRQPALASDREVDL